MIPQNEIRGLSKDEIIEMARQVGWSLDSYHGVLLVRHIPQDGLEALAKLVAAAAVSKEREACAKLTESFQSGHIYTADLAGAIGAIKHKLADAIRARGEAQ